MLLVIPGGYLRLLRVVLKGGAPSRVPIPPRCGEGLEKAVPG